jgi:tetrahydromethanopterin S-methyltransferase subunit A
MLKKLLGRPKIRDAAAAQRIKEWVRLVAEDDPEKRDVIAVTVSEIICADPGCPGTETVILIMQPGQATKAAKVAKPMEEVSQSDAMGAAVIALRG